MVSLLIFPSASLLRLPICGNCCGVLRCKSLLETRFTLAHLFECGPGEPLNGEKADFGHYLPGFKLVVFRLKLALSDTPCPLLIISIFPKEHWESSADQPFQAACMAEPLSRKLKGAAPMHQVRKHMEIWYLCRHEAGCDLLSAPTERSGRKCKPGVWQVKVFPSMSENVQYLESTPASLLSFISRSLPALHTDPYPMLSGLEHCPRQRHTRHLGLSFSVNR